MNKTIIVVVEYKTGVIVNKYDVTSLGISAQEKKLDSILHKINLDKYDVFMTSPNDNPIQRAIDLEIIDRKRLPGTFERI